MPKVNTRLRADRATLALLGGSWRTTPRAWASLTNTSLNLPIARTNPFRSQVPCDLEDSRISHAFIWVHLRFAHTGFRCAAGERLRGGPPYRGGSCRESGTALPDFRNCHDVDADRRRLRFARGCGLHQCRRSNRVCSGHGPWRRTDTARPGPATRLTVRTPGIATTAGASTSTSTRPGPDLPGTPRRRRRHRTAALSHNPFTHLLTKELTMLTSVRGVIAATAMAGSLLAGTAATAAADPPNCTAADLAGVMSGVSMRGRRPTSSPIPT